MNKYQKVCDFFNDIFKILMFVISLVSSDKSLKKNVEKIEFFEKLYAINKIASENNQKYKLENVFIEKNKTVPEGLFLHKRKHEMKSNPFNKSVENQSLEGNQENPFSYLKALDKKIKKDNIDIFI